MITVTDPRAEYERRLAHWRERIAQRERVTCSSRTAASLLASRRDPAVAGVRARVDLPGVAGRRVRWRSACWSSSTRACSSGTSARAARERAVRARLDRLDGRWAGTGRDGATFLEGHPYARDLDLFGPARCFSCSTRRAPRSAKRRSPTGCAAPARARRGARPAGGGRRAAAEARFPRGRRGARRRDARRPHRRAGAWAASAPAGFRPALARRCSPRCALRDRSPSRSRRYFERSSDR